MAAFKASARSLDQGVGAVLNGAAERRASSDRTLVVCTTDHGLAFPGSEGHAHRPRHRRDAARARPRRLRAAARWSTRSSPSSTSTRRFCELAGVPAPDFVAGRRRCCRSCGGETDALRDEVHAELTYHAAYEPQRADPDRAPQVHPPLRATAGRCWPTCDDGPTKDMLVGLGWADEPIRREQPVRPRCSTRTRCQQPRAGPAPMPRRARRAGGDGSSAWMREHRTTRCWTGRCRRRPGARINRRDAARPTRSRSRSQAEDRCASAAAL